MCFYCCNDAIPWLNEAKSRIFDVQWFLKFPNSPVFHLPPACHLPACHLPACHMPACHLPAVRPGSVTYTGPIFLTKNVIGVYNTNLLFQKRFIQCAMVIPFMLHWPSLFFSKVSNSWKKVLITPGLYFPNYCIMYLPCDISHDFKTCKHVNLRGEWTRVVFEELYYVASNQKIADKKKVDYQEGLRKSRADSAAQSHDSYMKDLEKSCAQNHKSYMKDLEKSHADSAAWSRKSYMRDPERVILTLQHEAAKFTRKNWRRVTKMKLAWLYPTKVKKRLQS